MTKTKLNIPIPNDWNETILPALENGFVSYFKLIEYARSYYLGDPDVSLLDEDTEIFQMQVEAAMDRIKTAIEEDRARKSAAGRKGAGSRWKKNDPDIDEVSPAPQRKHKPTATTANGFMDIALDDDDDLPF